MPAKPVNKVTPANHSFQHIILNDQRGDNAALPGEENAEHRLINAALGDAFQGSKVISGFQNPKTLVMNSDLMLNCNRSGDNICQIIDSRIQSLHKNDADRGLGLQIVASPRDENSISQHSPLKAKSRSVLSKLQESREAVRTTNKTAKEAGPYHGAVNVQPVTSFGQTEVAQSRQTTSQQRSQA